MKSLKNILVGAAVGRGCSHWKAWLELLDFQDGALTLPKVHPLGSSRVGIERGFVWLWSLLLHFPATEPTFPPGLWVIFTLLPESKPGHGQVR